MKPKPHLLYCLLLAVALTVVSPAQDKKPDDAPAAGKQPKLQMASTDFNFGEIEAGRQASHTFIVKNTGTADLEVKAVRPG
ncbi:MAG: DUF1573 domain-containing protein [Blastocatellia bacterium]